MRSAFSLAPRLACVLLLANHAAPLSAQDATRDGAPPSEVDQRLRHVEAAVERLEATQQRDGASALAGWRNGFFLQSSDKTHVLRITGQIQADYRNFLDGRDTTDIDGFLARRVRFGLEATVAEFYEFRLLPDYGQGKAVIQDAYLNVHYWDALQLQAGKFKAPFSYEQLIQDRFVPTLERSLIDQLAPARDVGVMVHGRKLLGDHWDYAVGVFNGTTNGDFDTSDNLDVAARLAWRPFRGPPDEAGLLQNLQLGIAATFGYEQEPAAPSRLRTPATVPWFQFNSGAQADGVRTRISPEVSYFWGSFGLAAQYLRQEQEFRPSPASPLLITVPMEGGYLLMTCLLTGEVRSTFSEAVVPFRDFDLRSPLAGPGAVEAVARVARLRVGASAFAAGKSNLADPHQWAAAATEMTVGFNWYWNRWLRWQFNWERAWFESPVQLGSGSRGRLRNQDSLLLRFQIIF